MDDEPPATASAVILSMRWRAMKLLGPKRFRISKARVDLAEKLGIDIGTYAQQLIWDRGRWWHIKLFFYRLVRRSMPL